MEREYIGRQYNGQFGSLVHVYGDAESDVDQRQRLIDHFFLGYEHWIRRFHERNYPTEYLQFVERLVWI